MTLAPPVRTGRCDDAARAPAGAPEPAVQSRLAIVVALDRVRVLLRPSSSTCSPTRSAARSTGSPRSATSTPADDQRRRRAVHPPAEDLAGRPASSWPARCGCGSCGPSSSRACTATSAHGRCCSRPSPARCSWRRRLGYYVLPKGLGILLGFTPGDVANLVEVNNYLNFILRMLLVFGVAFEIPVFVVLLNLAGIVSRQGPRAGHRPWIVLGTFVFAAVATPSTDPISMLFLAAPMTRAVPDLRGHRAHPRPAPARRTSLRPVRRRRGLRPRAGPRRDGRAPEPARGR